MRVVIRRASLPDAAHISSVLLEAAAWLRREGMPMWRDEELSVARVTRDIADGVFVIAKVADEVAGTMKLQLADPDIWPDVPNDDSVFVHRLAVRRRYAGGAVSSALLTWSVREAQALGRSYLRVDCDASRPRLRRVYERFGFRYHSELEFRQFRIARYELQVDVWDPEADASVAGHKGS